MAAFDQMDNLEDTRRQTEDLNPLHTRVTPQPIKTPLEVQLGLTLLPARYLPRALAKSATDSASPSFIHKYSGVNALRDFFSKKFVDGINQRLLDFNPQFDKIFANGLPKTFDAMEEAIKKAPGGEKLFEELRMLHRSWDAGNHTNNTIEYFLHNDRKGISKGSRNRLKGAMSEALFEIIYDNALGLGSLAYTYNVQNNVTKDIMNIYSEAVAYETNKDRHKITEDDVLKSDNRIIQQTIKNYRDKRRYRYGISLLPFAKNFPGVRAMQWGEAGVAAWGILWAIDIWGRKPTMMETFRTFINNKLNPLYGIGDVIKSSDILDMYQQYAYRFAPETAFRSLSVNDEDANLTWAKSEKVFVRIAQLMNESYNYKHTAQLDPETNMPAASADFTLPKFIYLLGHGLINIRRPEWSMAFVEIANKYDMDAVKEAAKAQTDGAEIGDVLAKYPVNLNPTDHINGISRPIIIPGLTQPQDAPPVQHKQTVQSEASPKTTVQEPPAKPKPEPEKPTVKRVTQSEIIVPEQATKKTTKPTSISKQTPDRHIDAAAIDKAELKRLEQQAAHTQHP